VAQTLDYWYQRSLTAQSLLPKGPEGDMLFNILTSTETDHDLMMFAIQDAERLIKGEN
jgi:hypothetical protein